MTERLTSTVYGFAPPSAELLEISGDIERGRRPTEDLNGQAAADFGLYSGVLEASGIDYRSGDWAGGSESDYLRDAARIFDGLRIDTNRGLTRWMDTNTFYRQPVIEELPIQTATYPHSRYLEWLKLQGSDGHYQPTLLSPYSFARLAARSEGVSEEKALEFSVALFNQLLAEIYEEGIGQVLFHEPVIPYSQAGREERERFIESISELARYEHADIGVFFGYGDASSVINELISRDIPLAAVGADLRKTPLEKIKPIGDKRFLAGLVDGANTLEQSDETLIAWLKAVAAVQDAAEISLTHTVDLEHVPRRYALQKIRQIGRVVELTGKEDRDE